MEKKICFISCVNDFSIYNENKKYIDNLIKPKKYRIEHISIKNANSMTEGYNQAMEKSNAKYKIYIHQDVFIIERLFLENIIKIFEYDKKIGMIGVIGAQTKPINGIWWDAKPKYGKVYENHTGKMKMLSCNKVEKLYQSVNVIDGLIMVTQYDIKWKEDLFDGWHFYDLSQSLEFNRSGYKVVVPKQKKPWCIHDCGIINIGENYNYYRKNFIKEYCK